MTEDERRNGGHDPISTAFLAQRDGPPHLSLQAKKAADLDDDDYAAMRKVNVPWGRARGSSAQVFNELGPRPLNHAGL